MTPINLFNSALVSYMLGKCQSSLRMGRPRAQCKWDRRRTNWQKQVKRASNTMGFNERGYLLFHNL